MMYISTSFILLAYKQERLVGDAVRSALAQDGEPMEIILSDDCSPDGTFEVMKSVASSFPTRHTVRLRRSKENLGIARHFEEVVSEASCGFLVCAAGDDISEPCRATKLYKRWLESGGKPALIYSDFLPIDLDGSPVEVTDCASPGPHSLASWAAGRGSILGATCAMTRDVLTSFPPLRGDVKHEDRVYPFRALLLGGEVLYVDEKLVRYRVEGGYSRLEATSRVDWLTRVLPEIKMRTLADAQQRFDDVIFARPDDGRLYSECERTILTQEALIGFGRRRSLAWVFRQVAKGARPWELIAHYLRLKLARYI